MSPDHVDLDSRRQMLPFADSHSKGSTAKINMRVSVRAQICILSTDEWVVHRWGQIHARGRRQLFHRMSHCLAVMFPTSQHKY